MIAIDLSKQQALNANPKAIQQINRVPSQTLKINSDNSLKSLMKICKVP